MILAGASYLLAYGPGGLRLAAVRASGSAGALVADAPAILGTACDYGGLLDLLRQRCANLGISREVLDQIAGLTGGYSSKILAPIPMRRLGVMSFESVLGALGCRIALVEDPERLKQISTRLVRRHEKSAHGRIPRLATISAELREELMAAARAELERRSSRRRGRANGRNGHRRAG